MKQYLVLIAVCLLFAGCGGSSLDKSLEPQSVAATYNGDAEPIQEDSTDLAAPDSAGADAGSNAERYIVTLKSQPGKATSAVSRKVSSLQRKPEHVYSHVLHGFAGELTDAEVTRLKSDPEVAAVEPDLKITTQAQYLPWGANRIDAELNTPWQNDQGGAGIGVAVFDTGIQASHPDLAGAVVANYNATRRGTFYDENGHGTHVAGIIGARRNSVGYVGVAPACKLINIKVMGADGSGYLSWAIAGLNWAVSKRNTYTIKVGNMSLGVYGESSALQTAINNATNAGIAIVAAAGNEGANAGGYIPAKYPDVICVSALDNYGDFAYYSNYGSVVDLIAPGSRIQSTYIGGGYARMSGTSMAAPHVAGALALWYDNHNGGVFTALKALKAAGESGSWYGDPDGVHEKLVDAQYL